MSHTPFDRCAVVLLCACTLFGAERVGAQERTAETAIRASEISVSRAAALLKLELEDGRELTLNVRDGRVEIDGRDAGPAPRGGDVDRSWRDLLNLAIDAPNEELAGMLIAWESDDAEAGRLLDATLESALTGAPDAALAPDAPDAPADPAAALGSDSVTRLVNRIAELQETVEQLEERSEMRTEYVRDDSFWPRPLRHIGRGIAGILSLLATYAVLFGIGVATIVFGGRRFIEGVGDTARHATVRSGLVGLAATFLILPAFILGILALVISIVGIPALLVFVPLFPLAVVVALLLGYLGVAHAAGEAFSERRYHGMDWFQRGNSYYFLISGLGLLMALFLGAQVIRMAGPWLGFIHGILMFLGCVLTWAVLSVGFGAVLISRGGTQPIRTTRPPSSDSDVFTEEAHV